MYLRILKKDLKRKSKNLYSNTEKQIEITEKINTKADEIENYVTQIITASREDFLSLEVENSDFRESVKEEILVFVLCQIQCYNSVKRTWESVCHG